MESRYSWVGLEESSMSLFSLLQAHIYTVSLFGSPLEKLRLASIDEEEINSLCSLSLGFGYLIYGEALGLTGR